MTAGTSVMAVIAGAITYIGLTSLAGAPDQILGGVSLLPFLPIPLWALIIYQSILTGISLLRSSSIRLLEDSLIQEAGITGKRKTIVGLNGTECVTNIGDPNARWAHRLSMLTINGLVWVSTVAYTVACMRHGYKSLGGPGFWALVLIYGALLGLTALSWWTSLDLSKERERLRNKSATT